MVGRGVVWVALAAFERIHNPHVEPLEVALVSSGDDEAEDAGGGGDHGVFEELVGFLVHDAFPFAEAGGILETVPLFDWDQDGSFDSAAGDDLRALLECGVDTNSSDDWSII